MPQAITSTSNDEVQKISKKPLEISDGKVTKGKWLKDKLNSLYDDPKFKTASPEQQKQYRSLAYDKWITPYYKNVLKDKPPTKDQWLTKNFNDYQTGTIAKDSKLQHLNKELGTHVDKTVLDSAAGLLHNLSYVGRAIDFIAGKDDYKPGEKNLEQILETSSKYYSNAAQQIDKELKEIHGNVEKVPFSKDIPGKMAELGTGAVIFEVTGGAKAAKILNVANPKTAALAYQMAKASWNGAVDYGLWSASQGEKPEQVAESFGTGGVLGPAAKIVQRRGLDPLFNVFKNLFKWGGADTTKQVVQQIVEKASTKTGKETPVTVQALARTERLSSQTTQVVEVASTKLDEMSQAKFKKPYADLDYIQKIHILNRVSATLADAMQTAKAEGMPKQLVQAQAKEQDELLASIFPEAKASQEQVEKFVQQHSESPIQTKLLASLPHHDTTVDSSWKHLQARANFLKIQLRNAKGEERKAISDALNEEYALMKQKSAKQDKEKILKNSSDQILSQSEPSYKTTESTGRKITESELNVFKAFESQAFKLERQKIKNEGGTVGSASANDPQVFKGDGYVVTPNVDPYKHGFTDWMEDSFAKGVAQQAKAQSLVKGQKQSFLANAINNSFLVTGNLSKQTCLGEGTTKQLFHPQFGLVGGVNYSVTKAASLGENSGLGRNENVLMINYLGMRPNVVARVWPVKGGGQALFLNAAMEADRQNIGIALIPFNESKSFYEKMGMQEIGSYMVMTKDQVKNLLRSKGLMMMLLGAGISYGANKTLSEGDYSVKGAN